MKKLISDCCRVEVYDVLLEIEYDHDDMPIHDYQAFCSQCHRPCEEIEEEDKKEIPYKK